MKLFWVLALFTITGLINGCASRNLRPDFKNKLDPVSKQEVLNRQWTYSIEPVSSSLTVPGIEYAAPTLHDNSLIFGSERYGLISLYPKLLRERWKIEIENGVVSPIVVNENLAYFTAGDGSLYAIQADTGKTVWSYPLRNPISSKPKVEGNDVYVVTSDDNLVALEANTGKWLWSYRRRNTSGPTIHGSSQPLVMGDTLWVGFADGALVCLTRKEGKILWEKQLNTGKRFASVNAEFLHSGNRVYVPAYDGALYALDSKSGNTIWVRDGLGGSKKVTLDGNVLYAPSSDGNVYALDAKTGNDLWKFELDNGVPSDVVATVKHLVVSSSSEYVYALEKATGNLVYRYHVGVGSGFSGGIAYDASRNWLYMLSRGGNLMAFSVRE